VAGASATIVAGMGVNILFSPLMSIIDIATLVLPVLITDTTMVAAGSGDTPVPVKAMLVIVTSFVSMKPMLSDPIHAATAMETATVTATSIMAATTGFKAFLFLSIFLNSHPSTDYDTPLHNKSYDLRY